MAQLRREAVDEDAMMEAMIHLRVMEGPRSEISSPEAKLGMRVEDLWDVQEPQLTPTEKLNACFESIPVSSFPQSQASEVIEIRSDSTLEEAVKILSKHKILSAPVVDVTAPSDASWIERYIGIVEFAGIVVWILHQSEMTTLGTIERGTTGKSPKASMMTAIAAAANGVVSPIAIESFTDEPASPTSGKFFASLTSSDFYKNTKVQDISGSFRWAPFLALQKSNSFLTMLLLLSKYKMKSVPVVDLGDGKVDTIITQASVIHMLAECAGLHWFESWGRKSLSDLGLPQMRPDQMIKVYEDQPVLQAFQLMRKKRVGGVPVVEMDGRRSTGNISIRDVHFFLTAPEIYRDYRSITARDFLTAVRRYLDVRKETSPMLTGMVTCFRTDTIKETILKLDGTKIHRIYVVDREGDLEGVITLRDIISKLVHEPRGYFGDFFDGVLPLPQNSRV